MFAQGDNTPANVFPTPLYSAAHTSPSSTSFPSVTSLVGNGELFENIRYNRVDGLFLGLGSGRRLSLSLDSTLLVHIGGGYAFGSHYWQVLGGVGKRFGARDWATIVGVEGHHYTDTREAWKIAGWENSLHAFIAGKDYRRYFQRAGWSVYAEQYIARNLWLSVRLGQERYHSLPTAITWSLLGGRDSFRANDAIREGLANTVCFSAVFSSVPKLRRALGGVELRAEAEIARRDYSYEQYTAEVVWRQPVSTWGAFTTCARIGSVRGVSEAVADFALGGVGSLPGYTWNESTGNRMGLWNAELLIRGGAFASGRIASSLSLILFANAGYAITAPSTALPFDQLLPEKSNQWMADIGAALGSRNGAIRIGAAWRTDRGAAPNLVVRLSPAL